MADRQFVQVSTEDRVATITIDHPPVNALSRATLAELGELLVELHHLVGSPDMREGLSAFHEKRAPSFQ